MSVANRVVISSDIIERLLGRIDSTTDIRISSITAKNRRFIEADLGDSIKLTLLTGDYCRIHCDTQLILDIEYSLANKHWLRLLTDGLLQRQAALQAGVDEEELAKIRNLISRL